MPLIFTEVKKPNNRDGILAERSRINRRFKNPKFRRFVNITQLMVFSNNMEYAEDSPEPLEGAFYATPSHADPSFNYFREEEKRDPSLILAAEDPDAEDFILTDTNLTSIKYSPEFATNKDPDSPTNRLSTALFSRDRLAFLLKYANDEKYARLHKRLMEKGGPTPNERKLFEALTALKTEADSRISQNARLLTNPAYAEKMMARLIIEQLMAAHQLQLTAEGCQFISNLVLKEYLAEFHGRQPA